MIERLIDRQLMETSLLTRPIHLNQRAFQTSKLCKFTIHQVVVKIEYSLNTREIALTAFLDIEGAIDKPQQKQSLVQSFTMG